MQLGSRTQNEMMQNLQLGTTSWAEKAVGWDYDFLNLQKKYEKLTSAIWRDNSWLYIRYCGDEIDFGYENNELRDDGDFLKVIWKAEL